MTGALLLVVLPLMGAAWILQTRALERRLRDMESRMASLSQRFFALSLWSEALERRLEGEAAPEVPAIAAEPSTPSPTEPAERPLTPLSRAELPPTQPRALKAPAQTRRSTLPAAAKAATPPASTPPPDPPPPRTLARAGDQAGRWKRIEGLLVENWSGLLGVLVVVAGVTFVTINAGLRLDAPQRFLLTLLAGAALWLPSLVWGRRERWRDLTDAMRSGGGALVLFACAAAGGLPRLGLHWIEAPAPALALLAAGVGANLGLAAIARTPTIASLHVAVSLVPLAIGPLGGPPLALATAVALVGYGLPLGHRWDRHRLTVIGVYALFQGTWYLRNGIQLAASDGLAAGAALAAVLVFGAGLLQLHRRWGVEAQLLPLPLALLLSQWGGIGLALLLYPRAAATRAAALAGAAALALLLALRARRRGPGWLALSDGLVAQTLAMVALLSLAPLIADGPLLTGALQVEVLLFLGIGERADSVPVRRIGWWLSAVAGLLLALAGGLAALGSGDPQLQLQHGAILTAGAALLVGAQVLLQRRGVPVPLPPLLGWLAGLQIFVAAAVAVPEAWRSSLSLAVMGAFLLAARRWRPPGLLQGVIVAITAGHASTWVLLLAREPWPAPGLLQHLLPLTVLSLLLLRSAAGSRQQRLGLALLGFDAGLGALLLLDPISPLLPGTAWLLLAAASLAVSRQLRGASVRSGLMLALAYLAAYGIAYLLVIAPSLDLVRLGALELRGRWLVELLAIGVFLEGWFLPAGPELARLKAWQLVHPCFLEAALGTLGLIVVGEISAPWRPVAWTVLALALVSPPLVRLFAVRLQVYGVLAYWLAVARLVANLAGLTPFFLDTGTLQAAGLVAILLQAAFVVASHRWLDLVGLRDPGGLPILAWIGGRVAEARNLWLYHPLFLAVAVVLATGYDSSLLTLLWTAEAIGIYLLGVGLREIQFRRLALIGLGVCLLRLLAIDMAQADLGLRGLVFIGVGLLLLGLNAIVHRLRSRFE
ncbi:MAG: hypothetical protein ER33_13240 [Cyanobium sp. CACIAM 14]|nr:MAG: hypothetical protein ER33_13240 [Cyanobium sp. CACIAM 14]